MIVAVSARALCRCSKLEVLTLDANLEQDAVLALVDGLSSRLVKLQVKKVPERSVDLIARRFAKLANVWMENAKDSSVRERTRALSNASVVSSESALSTTATRFEFVKSICLSQCFGIHELKPLAAEHFLLRLSLAG